MTFLIPLSLFGFGLIIGSFLNVVILRYNPDNSVFSLTPIGGRSHCMNCRKILSWHELIPLFSFLIQRGRCRSCEGQFSWQYPIVEFLSGLIFLTPFYFYNQNFDSQLSLAIGFLWTMVFLVFLVLAVIDYYWYIIPDELNIFLAVAGTVRIFLENSPWYFSEFSGSFINGYAALFGLRSDIWLNHLAGGLIGFLIIGAIILFTKGKGMGIGDLKLIAALGILFGWPDIVFLLASAFIIGALFSIYLLVQRKKGLKDSVPFGPFLILGAMTLVFFGNAIFGWYFGIFI